MAFGQQAGPPATGRQVEELLELLHGAGHVDFRDARGPMGFTQRQAGGKFTRDEAEAFIGQLQEAESLRDEQALSSAPATTAPATTAPAPVTRRPATRPARPGGGPSASGRSLSAVPDDLLAAELRRRGWTVTEP